MREPIVSMGDWRKARPGLTARERGLPPKCMQRVVDECGLKTVAHHQLGFGPLLKLANRMGGFDTWNSPAFTRLDQAASTAFRWNYKYHRTTIWQRFAPTVGFWALTKMT